MKKETKIKLLLKTFLVLFLFLHFTFNAYSINEYWGEMTSDITVTDICGYPLLKEMDCHNALKKKYGENTDKKCELSSYAICSSATVVDPSVTKYSTFNDDEYKLLAPIGGTDKIPTDDIGKYFNIMFNLGIGIVAALAVLMIILGGIQYMGNESIFGKTEGRKKIAQAIFGLLIALGSYALLNTINPDLLGGGGLNISQVRIKIEGDSNSPITLSQASLSSIGINCEKTGGFNAVTSIAKSFSGKMTYNQKIPKGQVGSDGTVRYDCSGFVNAVLQCAGINTGSMGINSGTSVIFSHSKSERVTELSSTSINGKPLEIGDLIGWRPSDDKNGNGHVMIYIGNGLVADSHGPREKVGKAYGEFSLEQYKDRIRYVLRTKSL